MDFIIGTGLPIKVTVNPGGPGDWPGSHVRREVYAIGYEGGETRVLVADNAGKLQWLGSAHYSVPVGPKGTRK